MFLKKIILKNCEKNIVGAIHHSLLLMDYQNLIFFNLLFSLCVCVFVLCICVCLGAFVWTGVCVLACLFLCLFVFLLLSYILWLLVGLFDFLPFCFFVCLSVCLSVSSFLFQSICTALQKQQFVYLFVCLFLFYDTGVFSCFDFAWRKKTKTESHFFYENVTNVS
jgi:hypothetical protein